MGTSPTGKRRKARPCDRGLRHASDDGRRFFANLHPCKKIGLPRLLLLPVCLHAHFTEQQWERSLFEHHHTRSRWIKITTIYALYVYIDESWQWELFCSYRVATQDLLGLRPTGTIAHERASDFLPCVVVQSPPLRPMKTQKPRFGKVLQLSRCCCRDFRRRNLLNTERAAVLRSQRPWFVNTNGEFNGISSSWRLRNKSCLLLSFPPHEPPAQVALVLSRLALSEDLSQVHRYWQSFGGGGFRCSKVGKHF